MTDQPAYQDYYSQHGIWGAYASFVLGKQGKGGGFCLAGVKPPAHHLYIGYAQDGQPGKLLPFMSEGEHFDGSTAFTAKKEAGEAQKPYSFFAVDEISRSVTLGSETFRAQKMSMVISSFFGAKSDPHQASIATLRDDFCPTLMISLTFDNTKEQVPLHGFFGMQSVMRVLSDSTDGRLLGLACGTGYGFATLADDAVSEILDWDCLAAAFTRQQSPVIKRLSEEGGLLFEVAPRTKRTFTLVLGVYESGVVTSLLATQRYYTSLFCDLEDVLEHGLSLLRKRQRQAQEMDQLLDECTLSSDQKLLIANAAHAYNASTELLLDNLGRPLFIVNEGEYRMMNTLDLVVDQAFWELAFSSWTLRLELEFLLERSSYTDSQGLAFCHDQGVADSFSVKGYSVYELPNLVDCFSYMSYEETLNWALTACLYVHNTGDLLWAKEMRMTFARILSSLIARDQNGDGIMDCDSSRCEEGSEITTYDSLDVSLGQARNNLYLAVKAWGTFHSLASLFAKLDDRAKCEAATSMADTIATTVCSYFLEDEQYIPAVFESGNRSMIIPAVEGLVYPYFCGATQEVDLKGRNQHFLSTLRQHLVTVLQEGRCIDAVSGGWKLSSTSNNTWLSKIFLNQFVASNLLGIDDQLVRREQQHCHWLFGTHSIHGMTDQVDSTSGKDLGSRLYPRLVTSILWMLGSCAFPHLSLHAGR